MSSTSKSRKVCRMPMKKKMDQPLSPVPPEPSSESTSAGKPDFVPRDASPSLAQVPGNTGMAVWGKVCSYGSKLQEGEVGNWLFLAIYSRQPQDSMLTCFVNWMDYTWVPDKKALVICQGTPILRTNEDGLPFLVLRCYGSKGVRHAINTKITS